MTDTKVESTPPKRGKWLRWLAGLVVVLALLLVAAYFVVTSSGFFKSVILPKVSAAAGAEVTVADASISPFSQVVLRDLKVQPKGAEPLLTATEVRLRYSLMDILGGKINVEEITISSPVVRVVMNADGTSNLDAFTQAKPGQAAAPAPAKTGAPPQVDVKKVAINNALVSFTQTQKDGSKTVAELAGLNFTADGIKNGQTAKLNFGANLKFAQGAATNLMEAAATLKSAFGIDLGPDLMPKQVKGDTDVAITSATGAFADAAQLNTKLAVDLSLADIKQLALNFTKNGAALGTLTVSGPFDAMKQEGKLKVQVTGIGNEVLSLVGGRFGIYFGSTKLAADYEIELKNQAQFVNTTGTITADKFSLTRSNLSTPVIDLKLAYNATIDRPKTNATIRAFSLNATQAGRPLLKANLSKEMLLDWSKGAEGVAESVLEMNLTELNLADWKPFLGEYVNSGVVNGTLNINVQKAGKLIGFDLGAKLAGLSGQFGSNRLDKADLGLGLRGKLSDFDKVDLSQFKLDASRLGQPVAALNCAGSFAATTRDADLQTDLSANLAPLSELLGRPDLALTAGSVKFTGKISQKNLTPARTNNPALDQSVLGKLEVLELTGRFASNRFDRFEATTDLELSVKDNLAEIRKCAGSLKQAGQAGGSFEANGKFHITNQVGDVTFKLTDLNQNTLRSFLAAALAPMSLDTISINANATARYDAKGDSGAKGDVQILNVLLSDPKGQLPKVPITAEAKLDAVLSAKGVAEIKQLTGNVKQGSNPAGNFDMTARYDLTNRTAQMSLKLAGLNQNALQPFLAPSLGDRSLTSVAIDANLTAGYDPKGDSAVKGDLQVTNLVVKDPTGAIPATPLEAKLKLDAALHKTVAEIREVLLTLTPTARAKNELQLKGQVDFTQTNAITGNLKLAADSMDATRYYDLFMNPAKPAATAPSAPKPAATPAPEKEPEAMKLPVKNFVFDASMGRFYLREVEITNFLTTLKLDGGTMLLKPFQLTLNGAPINATADLDLGVPGYKYDVQFQGKGVPLAPLVNSFVPDRKGQLAGTASASAEIKGAGVTGPSLQKNLAAQFDLSTTNLDLAVINLRSPVMKTLINVIVGIPDMIRNPGAALGNLLGNLTGSKSQGGGFVDEFNKSPIDSINARGSVGSGRVDLQQAFVQSPAFQAEARGNLMLAPVLTNSTMDLPISVALRRPLAEKVGLAGGTPTNVTYAKLPDFVKMKGTIGEPKTDINALALTAVALKAGSGMLGNTGNATADKASGILGAVGNLLGGGGSSPTTTSTNSVPGAATNAPAASPASSALGAFGNLLGGGKTTTSTSPPPANVQGNPPPATNAPANPFDRLFRKK